MLYPDCLLFEYKEMIDMYILKGPGRMGAGVSAAVAAAAVVCDQLSETSFLRCCSIQYLPSFLLLLPFSPPSTRALFTLGETK